DEGIIKPKNENESGLITLDVPGVLGEQAAQPLWSGEFSLGVRTEHNTGVCPSCNAPALIYQEGCAKCTQCSYSTCG
ncbi:hypothetical protein LCGC14_2988850, partial [marine sediment metagenome]